MLTIAYSAQAADRAALASDGTAPASDRAAPNDCARGIAVPQGELLFVFLDADGKFDPNMNLPMRLPRDRSHVAIPSEVLTRAKTAATVKVYHSSKSDSYIIPYSESRMKKDFDPANDCPSARANERVIHAVTSAKDTSSEKTACETVRLRDLTPTGDGTGEASATLLYDQTANACEDFARYQSKLATGELTANERAELKAAVTRFNEAFGGANRSPSIGGPATNISTRKTQEIGTSMQDRAPSSRDEKSGAGR